MDILFLLFCLIQMVFVIYLLHLVYRETSDCKKIFSVSNPLISSKIVPLVYDFGYGQFLFNGDTEGFSKFQLIHRDFQDPYQDIKGLLKALSQLSSTDDFSQINQAIKSLYQFQITAHLSSNDVKPIAEILANKLRSKLVGKRSVEKVEFVNSGQLFESNKMSSSNYGSYVANPLGVILLDSDNYVLQKAFVICK